jgi:Spy/CpxP family protein refolding chaperone
MKRSGAAAVLAVLAMAGLTVLAQEQGDRPRAERGPGGPRPGGGEMLGRIIERLAMDPKVAEELGLSAEQVGKIKAKAEELKAGRQGTISKLQAAEEKQRALMQAEPLDEAALLKGLDELGALRLDIARQDVKAMVAVHSILTPDQVKKLRERARERMQGAGEQRRERRGAQGDGVKPPAPPPPAE